MWRNILADVASFPFGGVGSRIILYYSPRCPAGCAPAVELVCDYFPTDCCHGQLPLRSHTYDFSPPSERNYIYRKYMVDPMLLILIHSSQELPGSGLEIYALLTLKDIFQCPKTG